MQRKLQIYKLLLALHDEMLRLRNEKQMDFLESLTGMDWE